jgi:RNA polymerase sigma-70 factor (ECF subfamily)
MPSPDPVPDPGARAGTGEAGMAADVVRRFARRLTALARRRLSPATRRCLDPEDIVQSVFLSFFHRYGGSRLSVVDWDRTWALLACITVRQCARGARQIAREAADAAPLDAGIVHAPTPEQAACVAETLEHLTHDLSECEREVFVLRLQGYSSREVSQRLGCTERKVQRVVQRVRRRLADPVD